MMFRFENETYLYALLIIPVLLLIFIGLMVWRKRAKRRYGHPALIDQLAPASSYAKHISKFVCSSLALLFIIVGLANPQIGKKLKEVERKGIDLFFVLDVSRSMLAQDIKPNRLERAKRAISQVMDNLKDDRVGLVVFAGNAYLQLPLTSDFGAAKMFLETIDPNMVPTQGTAIDEAIQQAQSGYPDEQGKHKAMIILSDGENLQGDAEAAATEAAEQGIAIHTVGIGTPSGSPIPLQDQSGQQQFHRDQNGEVVVTKLNESTLQRIAQNGDGHYIHFTGRQAELDNILQAIGAMEKKEYEKKVYTDYADKFQYFIALGIVFLSIEFFILERRSQWFAQLFKP
jgi:Ca-activated chloride channel family protein